MTTRQKRHVYYVLLIACCLMVLALNGSATRAAPPIVSPIVLVDGTDGVDKSGCGDGDMPCKTIAYALHAYAGTNPSLYISPGRYTENLIIKQDATLIGGYSDKIPIWPTRDDTTIIDGNTVDSVIVVSGADVAIESLTISGGLADKGGGVHVKSGTLTISDASVHGNEAGEGGGIALDPGTELTMENTLVTLNSATAVLGEGGGLWSDDADVAIADSRFTHNSATQDAGGAISAQEGDYFFIERTFFGANSARTHSGAILVDRIIPALVEDCLFVDNSTTSGTDTVLASSYSELRIVGCTIADNAPDQAYAVGVWSGTDTETDRLISINSIWWNNGTSTFHGPTGNYNVVYSLVQEGWAGEGNLAEDPQFVGAENYRLNAGSPCIDAGTTMTILSDFDGTPRPLDGDGDGIALPDMGCFESPALYRLFISLVS